MFSIYPTKFSADFERKNEILILPQFQTIGDPVATSIRSVLTLGCQIMNEKRHPHFIRSSFSVDAHN